MVKNSQPRGPVIAAGTWTERRYCYECSEDTVFEIIFDGENTDAICAFCGWDDQLYSGDREYDGGGWA
jgi:hypothetical protein